MFNDKMGRLGQANMSVHAQPFCYASLAAVATGANHVQLAPARLLENPGVEMVTVIGEQSSRDP